MLLKTVTLAGFKSFRKRTELPLSDRTTVLIGPNDHGKTNALSAIERLNPESKFELAEVNDQSGGKEDAYLSYTLSVNPLEIKALSDQMLNSESYKKAKQTLILLLCPLRTRILRVRFRWTNGLVDCVAHRKSK